MNCRQTQRLFDDMADGRLPEAVAQQLQRHLEECTDCRVTRQRSARLQQLLAVKRYEQPSPDYFGNFLREFHQRLEAETMPRVSFWERIVNNLAIEPVRTWRYGFSGAVGLALAVTMIWRGFSAPDVSARIGLPAGSLPSPIHLFASDDLPAKNPTPRTIAAILPLSTRATRGETESASAGSVAIVPVDAHSELGAPRYVLDRIGVTPASYEVASIHF